MSEWVQKTFVQHFDGLCLTRAGWRGVIDAIKNMATGKGHGTVTISFWIKPGEAAERSFAQIQIGTHNDD